MEDKIPPIVVGKFVPSKEKRPVAKAKLNAHLKYNQYRKGFADETREDRYLFSADNDHIQRVDAVNDVFDHTSYSALYHKIVLSPAEYEHVQDFKQWTRDIMNDLQEFKGVTLHWYAVVQSHERENNNTPHVHIVLAGAGEDHQSGKKTTVRMDAKTDYAHMRQSGRDHSDYALYRDLEQEWQDLDMLDSTVKDQEQEQEIEH